jgi:hypothetical protein
MGDLGRPDPRVESQLPAAASYSHCQPFPVADDGQLSGKPSGRSRGGAAARSSSGVASTFGGTPAPGGTFQVPTVAPLSGIQKLALVLTRNCTILMSPGAPSGKANSMSSTLLNAARRSRCAWKSSP